MPRPDTENSGCESSTVAEQDVFTFGLPMPARSKRFAQSHAFDGRRWLRGVLIASLGAAAVWMVSQWPAESVEPTLLEEIRESGTLTILTRNGASSYFTAADGETGPEYELAHAFARFLGVELQVHVADAFGELETLLNSGQGDMIAANLTRTPERLTDFRFGPSYDTTHTLVVFRRDIDRPKNLNDLAGLKGGVVAASSYAQRLENARQDFPGLDWQPMENAGIEDLMLMLDEGQLDYTLVDERIFTINRDFYPNIGKAFTLPGEQSLAWAFARGDDDSLAQQARVFMQKARGDGTLMAIEERFFKPQEKLDRIGMMRFIQRVRERLPPWLPLFQEVAAEQQIDWRLLAAMGYQESHWDAGAVSPTGVRGLMMLTQNTANELGVEDRRDPLQSIRGGAQYFVYLYNKLPERISEPDRTWMALAAYNMGYGHLQDARRLTERMGGNPDQWEAVEKSVGLLTQKQYYSEARHGYARGRQAQHYVENIQRFYETLKWMDTRAHPLLVASFIAPP